MKQEKRYAKNYRSYAKNYRRSCHSRSHIEQTTANIYSNDHLSIFFSYQITSYSFDKIPVLNRDFDKH